MSHDQLFLGITLNKCFTMFCCCSLTAMHVLYVVCRCDYIVIADICLRPTPTFWAEAMTGYTC